MPRRATQPQGDRMWPWLLGTAMLVGGVAIAWDIRKHRMAESSGGGGLFGGLFGGGGGGGSGGMPGGMPFGGM